jgi:hypothetical protein
MGLYCTLVRSPPTVSPPWYPPAPLKAIAREFIVLFHINMWSPSTIYPHSPSFTLSPPTSTPPPILQSCLLLWRFKSMFKGVPQCVPAVTALYFGPLNAFHCSPFLFPSHPPCFPSCQYKSLYLLPSQMWCFMILLTLYHSLFLPLLPRVPQSSKRNNCT